MISILQNCPLDPNLTKISGRKKEKHHVGIKTTSIYVEKKIPVHSDLACLVVEWPLQILPI